eukprot:gene30073-37549_t
MGFNHDIYPASCCNPINDGEYHKVVVVYDGDTLYLAVDDKLQSSHAETFDTRGQSNFLGKSNDLHAPKYFKGEMKGLEIYSRAWTPFETYGIAVPSSCARLYFAGSATHQ